MNKRWASRTVTVAFMALFLSAIPTTALAAGRNYAFYNGDVCRDRMLSACLSQSGAMNYGTLFQNIYGSSTKWRSGSGDGSQNRCASNSGPIPQGTTSIITHYDNKSDGSIHGRAWQLGDMRCVQGDPNSTLRTQLFMHTEETPSQGQTCGSPYDEHWCWDGPSDYYSIGCVKVSHSDVATIDSKWHAGSVGSPVLTVDAWN
jgi:hypothetical protein